MYASKSEVKQPSLGKLHAALAQSKSGPVCLAFAGSSSVAGSNATSADKGFVNLLNADIQAAYPSGTGTEHFVVTTGAALSTAPGVQSINAGVGGRVASNILNTTERSHIAAANPSALFVMIGSNDWFKGVPPAEYRASIETFIADMKIRINTPCVYILCHAFRRADVASPAYPYSHYKEVLQAISAADPQNVAFIDVEAVGEVNGLSAEDPLNLLDMDMVHPTDAGHAVIKDTVLEALHLRPPVAVISSGTTRTAVTAPPAGHPIALDYFARADGDIGSALSGQAWSTPSGTWVVGSGKARASTSGTVLLDIGESDDLYISTAMLLSTTEPAAAGVIARAVGDTSRVGAFLDPTGLVNLWIKYGTFNAAVAGATPGSYRASAMNIIGLKIKGNTITTYLNGVQASSYTLNSRESGGLNIAGNTNVGLRSGLSTLHKFDSFAVQSI